MPGSKPGRQKAWAQTPEPKEQFYTLLGPQFSLLHHERGLETDVRNQRGFIMRLGLFLSSLCFLWEG